MKLSSILSAKFDCLVARQNTWLLRMIVKLASSLRGIVALSSFLDQDFSLKKTSVYNHNYTYAIHNTSLIQQFNSNSNAFIGIIYQN